jgi:hypothetical protein
MSRFPGPTWTSSHVYGQGSMNLQKKFCYFNIPKCASMWMRKYLSNMGEQHADHGWIGCNFTSDNLDGYTPLVLLRDPVERWISACPALGVVENIVTDIGAIADVLEHFDSWMEDEHTTPQFDFIDGLDLSRAMYFYCDHNLSKNIQHFFQTQGIDTVVPEPTNIKPDTLEFQSASGAWKKFFTNPTVMPVFTKKFARDYALIESVKFYRDGE